MKKQSAEPALSKHRLAEVAKDSSLLIGFIAICVVFSVMSPVFFTNRNIINVLSQISINVVLAIGATFVIITGGIDLGLGSYVAFTGVLVGLASQSGMPLLPTVLIGVASGAAIGAVNGLLVTFGRLAPFIVTLGMMTITRGAALVFAHGRPVSNLAKNFNAIAKTHWLGIPAPVYLSLLLFAVAGFILRKTIFGRHVYAVGGNEEAARESGISVTRTKIGVYTICGGLAGVAGNIQASRIATGQPNIGVGYELDAIAAVVIGGISLSGGSGKIFGTLIGALIIGVINNGLDLLNVSSYYQQIIKGLIIVGALLIDRKKDA